MRNMVCCHVGRPGIIDGGGGGGVAPVSSTAEDVVVDMVRGVVTKGEEEGTMDRRPTDGMRGRKA